MKPSGSTRRLIERHALDRPMVGRMLVRFYGWARRDTAPATAQKPAVKALKVEGGA